MVSDDDSAVVEIVDLEKHFPITAGLLRRTVGHVRAVDKVSFTVFKGETLGLVGESGCGKSTTGRLLLRLLEPTGGQVLFDGRDLTQMSKRDLRRVRRDMQVVFQDPNSSLHPRMTVGQLIAEPIKFHGMYDSSDRVQARVKELMEIVGLSPDHTDRYPHEFSGGQRQRIGIARGLSVSPRLLVCDEPVSALDVSIQAQVLNLLKDLQVEFGLSYLIISHDLSVVRYVSDRVAVMYLGRIVEIGQTDDLFNSPYHPYTEALLSAVPSAHPSLRETRERIILTGDVANPSNPPSGCHFHPRCPYVVERCRTEDPQLRMVVANDGEPRPVACHRAEELVLQGSNAGTNGARPL